MQKRNYKLFYVIYEPDSDLPGEEPTRSRIKVDLNSVLTWTEEKDNTVLVEFDYCGSRYRLDTPFDTFDKIMQQNNQVLFEITKQ